MRKGRKNQAGRASDCSHSSDTVSGEWRSPGNSRPSQGLCTRQGQTGSRSPAVCTHWLGADWGKHGLVQHQLDAVSGGAAGPVSQLRSPGRERKRGAALLHKRKPRDEQDQEATTSPRARAAKGQMMLQSYRHHRPAGAGTTERRQNNNEQWKKHSN